MNMASPGDLEKREEWSPATRIAFRWAFLFFVMMAVLPILIWKFTAEGILDELERDFWRAIVPWVTRHIFRVTEEITTFGNGDSAFSNLRLLIQALLAAVGALVWTTLSRGALEYNRLHYWLRVGVRYSLADWLLSYGIAKVFHVQFAYPDLTMLLRPFGELDSPMRLLWAFMGFSRPYQIFAGVVECSAAILLFWNRTTTLGALLSIGALVNVLVMDWSYGVSVKMIVVRMLLCAGLLLANDAQRLARVFLWNLPTQPAVERTPWMAWRWKRVVQVLKIGIVTFILGSQIQWAAELHPTLADVDKPPLYGVYRVERHSVGGLELSTDDSERWNLLAFDNRARGTSLMALRRTDETWWSDLVEYDEEGLNMTVGRDEGAGALQISRPSAETVLLEGSFDGNTIVVTLRRLQDPRFPLEENGQPRWIFRW